jgi:integral membrane protein (TIGR01906 family)
VENNGQEGVRIMKMKKEVLEMLQVSVRGIKWNWLGILASILVGVFFIIMMLFNSILSVAFDIDFYEAQYDLLGRPQTIGISKEELMRVTDELLDYMAGRREALDSRAVIQGEERYVFNAREIAHMVDVRNLFAKANTARAASLITLIVMFILSYAVFGKNAFSVFLKSYIAVSSAAFLILGALYLFAVLDFTLFWDLFHRLTFDNYLWLLDPRTDILIQMVPEQFFYNTVMRIIIYFVTAILVPAIASLYYLCIVSRKNRNLSKQGR